MTRVGLSYGSTSDAPFLILPVMYDTQSNVTQLVEKKDLPSTSNALSHANLHVKRFAEYNMSHGECTLFPTIRDFLTNFSLPSEPPTQVSKLIIFYLYVCNTIEKKLKSRSCLFERGLLLFFQVYVRYALVKSRNKAKKKFVSRQSLVICSIHVTAPCSFQPGVILLIIRCTLTLSLLF